MPTGRNGAKIMEKLEISLTKMGGSGWAKIHEDDVMWISLVLLLLRNDSKCWHGKLFFLILLLKMSSLVIEFLFSDKIVSHFFLPCQIAVYYSLLVL